MHYLIIFNHKIALRLSVFHISFKLFSNIELNYFFNIFNFNIFNIQQNVYWYGEYKTFLF